MIWLGLLRMILSGGPLPATQQGHTAAESCNAAAGDLLRLIWSRRCQACTCSCEEDVPTLDVSVHLAQGVQVR
jgi:hypothetical protein